MDKSSELDCYLFYMWNAWCKDECIAVFPADSIHIWDKWTNYLARCGAEGAPAPFYANLDKAHRKALVDHAIKHYNPS